MPHTITSKGHPASMAEREKRRERNSGDVKHADVVTKNDKGWNLQIHHSGNHVVPRDARDVDIHSAAKQNAPGASK